MKVTPRIVLLAGLLGSAAGAWCGFLLGGVPRHSALQPSSPPVAVEKRHATADTAAVKAQPPKILLSTAPTHSDADTLQQQPTVLNATKQMATSVRGDSALVADAAVSPPNIRRHARVNSLEQAPPRYPLVLQEVPANVLNSQPGVAAAMDRLREKFITAVGGTGQNPTDPAYQARWTQNVSAVEEQLRAAVGWETYNRLQAAAYLAQKTAP